MNPGPPADAHSGFDDVLTDPEAAFAIVGNGTRLQILHELWKERDPKRYPDVRPVPFAELRKHVGMRDGSQFNYHLKQLVGPFVHRTEGGYVLRRTGERIVIAALAGELADDVVLDAEAIDRPCPLCDGQVVLDYGVEPLLDYLVVRCTDCVGAFTIPDAPSGVLSVTDAIPPIGMRIRSTEEMYDATQRWVEQQFRTIVDGLCPHCSGTLGVTALVCEDHDTFDSPRCETCGALSKVLFYYVCDVCRGGFALPLDRNLVGHPTVQAFYHDHDYETWGHDWLRIAAETIESQTVVAEDPRRFEVVVDVADDRLVATLDDTGDVLNVTT